MTPNTRALAKQIDRVATQVEAGEQIGRGVDEDTLRLYREATEGTEGPRYEIHSTEYGLALKAPSHYVASCFDYVVTSSSISHRFAPGSPHRERFPEAAHFYDQLDVDPRFQQVYQAAPEAWNSSGPVITVYRIAHDCGAGEQAE